MISHKAEDGDGLAEFTIQRTSFFVTVKVVEYCEGSRVDVFVNVFVKTSFFSGK